MFYPTWVGSLVAEMDTAFLREENTIEGATLLEAMESYKRIMVGKAVASPEEGKPAS